MPFEFGVTDSWLNCRHNQSRAKAALPAWNTFLESCSLNATTLGGEMVPIQRRALSCTGRHSALCRSGPGDWAGRLLELREHRDYCNFGFDNVPPTDNWNDRVSKSGESQLWCYGFEAPTAPLAPSSGVHGVG